MIKYSAMSMTPEDFIGIFDNAFSTEYCQKLVNYYEQLRSMNLTYSRQQINDGKAHEKQDDTAFLLEEKAMRIDRNNPIVTEFMETFWGCYKEYADRFSVLHDSETHSIMSIRLQKTRPGEGYHKWHYESSSADTSRRIVAWMLYLNNITDGGETEFLYQRRRVAPIERRLVIWPAAFTHTHRGNPPLSENKYILTGWVEFAGKA